MTRACWRRPQHVIEDQQVFVAQILGGLGEVAHPGRVGPDFGLRKDGSQLHRCLRFVRCGFTVRMIYRRCRFADAAWRFRPEGPPRFAEECG